MLSRWRKDFDPCGQIGGMSAILRRRAARRDRKTDVDFDSGFHLLDELNQNPSVIPLVHFEAIRKQHAF